MICGFAVVPQKGALTADADAAAILVLMEGGQVVLYDLPDLRPVPLSLPFQELPDLTASQLTMSAGTEDVEAHSITLERLKVRDLRYKVVRRVLKRRVACWPRRVGLLFAGGPEARARFGSHHLPQLG